MPAGCSPFSPRVFSGANQPITKRKRGAVLLCGGETARRTARSQRPDTLLHQMRAVPLARLLSHDTDRLPAAEDAAALHQAARLAVRLNGGEFAEGADVLDHAAFRDILAASIYQPTPERLSERVRAFQRDPAVTVLGLRENGAAVRGGRPAERGAGRGDDSQPGLPRRSGGGRASAAACWTRRCCACIQPALLAETDDGAVGFYRKYGCTVRSLGRSIPA